MAFRKSSLFLLILHIISLALAEPVQYCRFGHRSNAVDFCMGVTMHHNHTSGAHDMYMSFAVTRSSHLGWTAIGTGPSMKGALMFIMYGDPGSGVDPILSIRTVDGHNQPREITPHDMGGSDIRVLQSMWMPAESRDSPTSHTHSDGTAMYEARMAVVCYACTRWPGSPILASSSSQAWIWAWNDQQELPVYSFDANLQMHKHHAGNGGWGVFYMDLVRSVSDAVRRPSLPPLRLGISTLGTSDTPIGASGLLASLKANALVNAHGFFMGAAFMLLFPVGVVAIRSGSTKAFKYHWVIQVVAMCFVVVGVVTGLKISGNKITVPHQWVGLFVAVALVVQSVLGHRHHVLFLRIKQRTWISHSHIWLGRLVLFAGAGNILSGMILVGQGRLFTSLVGGFVFLELVGLGLWPWIVKRRTKR